jgi:hypothetical protein
VKIYQTVLKQIYESGSRQYSHIFQRPIDNTRYEKSVYTENCLPMNVYDALKQRKSVRAFLDRPVEREVIECILDAARWAPSGVNTQPWQVAVVRGEKKRLLEEKLESNFYSGVAKAMDYAYYPAEWTGVYRERRKVCGLQLFSTLQIGREDTEKQTAQWAANYRAFDAPVMLFFLWTEVWEPGLFWIMVCSCNR